MLNSRKEDIEYPAGGGGIYSHTGDYSRILQHLLAHYLSLSDSSVHRPSSPLLSDKSVESLFKGTLDPRAYEGIAKMMTIVRGFGGDDGLKPGEADWTTGMALFQPEAGRGSSELSNGRKSGSVGWGGAAGTEYWIDPVSKIAVRTIFTAQGRGNEMINGVILRIAWVSTDIQVCYTTQAIVSDGEIVANAKKEVEKLVYEVLAL